MRQKGFVLLPVIIIIALLGVVGYLVYKNTQIQKISGNSTSPSIVPTANLPKPSPTPDLTTNWKNITNRTAGLSVQYPPTMTAKQSDNYISLDLQTIKPDTSGKGAGGSNLGYSPLYIQISRKPEWDSGDIGTIAKDELKQAGVLFDITNIKILDGTINNTPTKYFSLGCTGYCTDIFLKQNNQTVFIEILYGSKDELQIYESLANQILSTFKLTD